MTDGAATGEPAAPGTVQTTDDAPARVRRSLDLIRLSALALAIVLIGLLAAVAGDTVQGVNDDFARLLNQIPSALVRALSAIGAFGALALPVALVGREIVRGRSRRLVEGLLTGLLAIGVISALDRAFSSGSLHRALTEVGNGTADRPLDAYLAALFALALIIGATDEAIWRAAFWIVVGVYVVSAFAAAQASPLSLLASPAIGAAIGYVVRYGAGSANERPDAHSVAAELGRRGLAITRMERVIDPHEKYRCYRATTVADEQVSVYVFDRDLVTSGAVYGLYRLLRIRAAVAAPPALSLERVAERRTLLALAATAAGAGVPKLLAGVPCGPDAIVLAYESVAAAPLTHPTDDQLAQLWSNVGTLHRARITHRGLTAEGILLDCDGRVLLPILTDGAAFASELRIRLDRVQLLITTAQLAGADRAVQVARSALSDAELAAIIPLLQSIALPRETRAALTKDDKLLESVREQIQDQTRQEPPETVRVERFRPRVVLSIVAGIIAAYLLVGQLGSVDLVTVFSTARWRWVPFVLVASAGTYLAAALSLTGYVRERLSFVRTVLVQVAAAFVGFVAPPSVGGLALNVRYLRKAGLSVTGAATSVGLSQAINAVSHAVLLIVVAAATGASADTSLPVPGWAFIALGVLAVLVLLLLAIPGPRRWLLARILPPIREAVPRLLDLLTSPFKLAEALTGTLMLNVCYTAALWFAVHAFGGGLSLTSVAAVYLLGAAVASAAPTPGGLGAVEVALSTGLVAAGMPSAAAVSAVLLFRLATFWLPVPAGWLALHVLQRRGAL